MEELTPRDQIPESWLDRIRCPYCSTAPLRIERPSGSPENFSCPSCELAFRIAKADSSIFILRDPIGTRTGFVGQWVNVKSFAQSMRNQANESQAKQQGAARKPELYASGQSMASEDPIFEKYSAEVIKNAADLYELGHGKGQIKETLSRYSGLRDDEIEEIFEYISKDKTSKAKVNISVPTWAMAAILVPFLCLLFYGIGVFIQYRMASSFEPGDEPRTVSILQFGNLPEDMQNNVPDSVMDISMPVPVITPLNVTGGEIAACPADAEAAVALYGAEVEDWKYHGLQKTWQLQSVYAEQITIPEGHLAVIPTIHEGISIRLVPGPVVINNSYLVMVRCP